MISQLPICAFSQDVILCSHPIDMDFHFIKNLNSSVNKLDVMNKADVDRDEYKQLLVIFLILL